MELITPLLVSVKYYLIEILYAKYLKTLFSLAIAGLSYALGGFDQVVLALLILMILDFSLGFSIGWMKHRVSREKMMRGLVKMIIYGIGIIVGNLVDIAIMNPFDFGLRNIIVTYLALTEALSILRNAQCLGLPLPPRLIARLEAYREKIDEKIL